MAARARGTGPGAARPPLVAPRARAMAPVPTAMALAPQRAAAAVPVRRRRAAAGRAEDAEANRRPWAVIFDVDGTLADSTQLAFTATNEVLARNGHAQVSIEEYRKATIHTTPRRMAVHAHGDPDHPDGATLGADFDDTYVARVSEETTPFFPHVAATIHAVADQGARLGVLSNACGEYAREVCAANGDAGAALARWDCVFGADDVPAPKPAPDGLHACIQTLLGNDADHSCVVYVGDAPTDGTAARAAGCRSVAVAWGAHSADDLRPHFDVVVEEGTQLYDAIANVVEAVRA